MTRDLPSTTTAGDEPPPLVEARLVVIGPAQVTSFPLAGELVIGRDPSCAVCLPHDSVSRRHAVVRPGTPATLQDLGSRNGLTLHGAAVHGGAPVPLAPGDTFRIGPFVISLVVIGTARDGGGARSALVIDDPSEAAATPTLVRIAESAVNVLVRGETGTGKEVLARTLHARSGRNGPLLALNCAAFSPALLESELFGHERGAFTGAAQAKPGLLEAAAGGSVFLDELGELSLDLQAKLLRAIEAREVLRVGGLRPVPLDVRFLAATHRDLLAEVTRATFRQDLYYRIAGITLMLPPLRDRPAAILPLALRFVPPGRPLRLAPDAIGALRAHTWPGNVRELRNVVERAALLCEGDEVRAEHIVLDVAPGAAAAPREEERDDERARIVRALDACAGNQTRAARLLGISRATLATKLARYEIPRPRD